MQYRYNDGGRAAAGFKGDTSDCVCRAIAIATGKPYLHVYYELIGAQEAMVQSKRVRGSHPRTGVNRKVYESYLKIMGWVWVPTMQIGSGCKVHLKDGELPMGNLIVRLSKHLAAVVDGVVNDTHDCTREGTRCVYGYYIKQ